MTPTGGDADPTEASGAQLICRSEELAEGGEGIRFAVARYGKDEPAFLIRWQGHARAFFNRCGHIPVELDYQPGQFFDYSGHFLVCATHGALYDPASGTCQGGRCNGVGLEPIPVVEQDGGIYLQASSKDST